MRTRFAYRPAICSVVIGAILSLAGCAPIQQTPIRVLFAGSLIVPFDALEAAYEESHPGVDVQMEGHGSIQAARIVSELHEPADIVAVADSALIPLLMYDAIDPETDRPYADWMIEFATNRLTLAYTDSSRYADEINEQNWYQILARDDIRLGLPDPRFDAAGYRGLMSLQLAERYYQNPTLFDDIVAGRFQSPIRVRMDDGVQVVHVPEIVEPKAGSSIVLRGGSVQLIALLESGDVDYAFEYESVSRQHGFRTIDLPDAIDFGSAAEQPTYEMVEVLLDFQRFATVAPVFRGDVIRYGITIPSNATHPDLGADFLEFLLGPDGQAIMAENRHPTFAVSETDHLERLPESLRPLCAAAS